MSQPTSPDIGSFEESLNVTIYPSDDTFLISWESAELQAHANFITSAAGWDLVNGWPKRQTAAEKTLSKLQAVIGPSSTYLPEVKNLQFKENDYKYSSGMLPLRVLVGMVAPDYSYSFRHGAGVWAIQQDTTHDSPGVKLLAHLLDGTLVELPCSDWTSIKKLVIFDNDIHDHIREPSGVNEFLMQVQYCFLIAAANKLNGFDGKKLPVHCKIAGVLGSLTSRMALEAGMKADEQQANTEFSMPMDGSLVLVDESFGCESPSSYLL